MGDRTSLEYGLGKIDAGDYEDAFKILLPYAEDGKIDACSKVGVLYQLGLGVDRNITKAINYLNTAAEQGNGEAAHNLGTLYLSSEPELPNEPEKSKFWYKKAQELGFEVADKSWYE